MFYQRLLKLGKYHFCIMCERTLSYRTDNIQAKISKSWKWEEKQRTLKMHVCVGWFVNSLWRYTMLRSNNFIDWMISMIATVGLWRHCNILQIRLDLYIIWYVIMFLLSVFWNVHHCVLSTAVVQHLFLINLAAPAIWEIEQTWGFRQTKLFGMKHYQFM